MNTSDPGLAQRNPLLEGHFREADAEGGLAEVRSASRHRVLFVINSLEGGGAERVFSALVNHVQTHLDASGIDVLLLDDKPQRFEIDPAINIECLHSNGSLWDSAWRFGRYVAVLRPKVIISFLPRANYLATAFAPIYGYRCIISERSDTNGRIGAGLEGWLEKQLLRTLYPRAHRLICVAEGIRRSLVRDYRVAPETVCAIHNPVDLTQLDQLAQEPCAVTQDQIRHGFIVAVGRLTQVKRFDLLIRAYAAGNFEQSLMIVGEGPALRELQNLASTLGIAERVLFPGFLPNPYAVMARASVFVLSSDREGFPNGLVEAMAVGIPVIATNCYHGPAEILDDAVLDDDATSDNAVEGVHQGKYGLLVPTNDVDALTCALRKVLADQTLRTSLAELARQRARHFSAPIAISRYAAVINEQLALVGRTRG
jgi:glycosyltransferase involved in cell wall biosynthesis